MGQLWEKLQQTYEVMQVIHKKMSTIRQDPGVYIGSLIPESNTLKLLNNYPGVMVQNAHCENWPIRCNSRSGVSYIVSQGIRLQPLCIMDMHTTPDVPVIEIRSTPTVFILDGTCTECSDSANRLVGCLILVNVLLVGVPSSVSEGSSVSETSWL